MAPASTDKTKTRKWETATKLMDLGNIACSALLFSQAFSEEPFNFWVAFLGIILLAWLYSIALILMRGGDQNGT